MVIKVLTQVQDFSHQLLVTYNNMLALELWYPNRLLSAFGHPEHGKACLLEKWRPAVFGPFFGYIGPVRGSPSFTVQKSRLEESPPRIRRNGVLNPRPSSGFLAGLLIEWKSFAELCCNPYIYHGYIYIYTYTYILYII